MDFESSLKEMWWGFCPRFRRLKPLGLPRHPANSLLRWQEESRPLRGPKNWHHGRLLTDLAQISVAVNDRMEAINQSVAELFSISVVDVPSQAMSKAKGDPDLWN